MVIKSGTHNFHGTLWEFNRNEDYDANNYFTKLAGQSRPELRLNEPGGNIGDPVDSSRVQRCPQQDVLLRQ